jgi:hypothetical protein
VSAISYLSHGSACAPTSITQTRLLPANTATMSSIFHAGGSGISAISTKGAWEPDHGRNDGPARASVFLVASALSLQKASE